MKSVGQLKDEVAGLLQGTNLNNVTNLNGAIERAARVLVQQADVPEASGRETYMLYDGVYDYPAPGTIFGGAVNDLRPQGVSRTPLDYVYKQPIQLFDRTKALLPNGYSLTFEYRKGTGIMRVANTRARQKVLLDPMDSATGWSVGGTASNLAVDETVYYQSPAGLRFNLTGAGTGSLEKTLSSPIDLTSYQGVGVGFLAIDTPSATDLTSIEFRIGSDPSNYYSVTSTEGFLGSWVANDYLLVAFDLADATTVGSPVITAMDYLGVFIAHSASMSNMRTGYLFISLPSPNELLFQSAAVFMASGSNPSNTISDDNDSVILNDAAYTIFVHECALTISLQNGGSLSTPSVQMLTDTLHNKDRGLYVLYRANNPSNQLRSVGSYYEFE